MPDAEAIATVVVDTVKRALAPVVARLDAIEVTTRDAMTLRERIAVLETRAPVPGPAGPAGKDGSNGADGFGFDDLSVEFDGQRTLALRFERAGVVKTFPLALPFPRYQGTYQEGVAYVIGDVVTAGGAAWHCQRPTTLKPGDSVDAWRLMVRKGRDGRDAIATVHR